MANANFTAWLGNSATSGQQTQYNSLTSGFQAGGFVKAEDFNAALRMTTLICAGIADGFGFATSVTVDSAESVIANAIKNPTFTAIKAGKLTVTTLAPTTTNGIVQVAGGFALSGGMTLNGVATFNQSAMFKNIICTNEDGMGAFKSLTATSVTATNITAATLLKSPKANLTNIYGATDADIPAFPQGAKMGDVSIKGDEITGASNIESTTFAVPAADGSADLVNITRGNAIFNNSVQLNGKTALKLPTGTYDYKTTNGTVSGVQPGMYLAQLGSFMTTVVLIPSGKISSTSNYFTPIAMNSTTTELGLAVSQSTATFTVTVQSHNLSTNSYSTYTNTDLYLKRIIQISV